MKNRFIVIGSGQSNSILNHSFAEVIQGRIENAIFLNPYNFKCKFIEKTYNYVYRQSNRRFFKWIPNSIWNHFSVLNQIFPEPNEKIYLIFVIGRDVDRLIVPSLLTGMKKKFGHRICTVLLLFDSIEVTKDVNGWGRISDTFHLFDIVATFDKIDAFIFWFVLLLIKVEWRKRVKYAIAITLLSIACFVILKKTGLLINALSYIVSDDKIELYFVADKYHSSSGMVLRYIISQPVLLIAILFLIKKFRKYEPNNIPYINAVIGMDVLTLVLCPVFFYSLQFRRMLRVLFIPSFIAIEKLAPRKYGQMAYIARIAMLIFSLIALYWNLYSNPELLRNLFSNNYFY